MEKVKQLWALAQAHKKNIYSCSCSCCFNYYRSTVGVYVEWLT